MSDFAYTVRNAEAEVSLDEYLGTCVDVPRFQTLCRPCPNFGHNWSCPPYDFDPMDIWRAYRRLRIVGRILIPTVPGQDTDAAMAAVFREKDALLRELYTLEAAVPGSRALAAGRCQRCAVCARADGQPCRSPEALRYSLESLGADVMRTAEQYLGTSILWIRNGVVPERLVQVGGLLLP